MDDAWARCRTSQTLTQAPGVALFTVGSDHASKEVNPSCINPRCVVASRRSPHDIGSTLTVRTPMNKFMFKTAFTSLKKAFTPPIACALPPTVYTVGWITT